jgi:hypothetical protein
MLESIEEQGLKYPADLCKADGEVIENLRTVYLRKASEYSGDRQDITIIDKHPLNTIDIALIHRVFPDSKIIFALRHPADVCLSCFFQDFNLNGAMIHFLDLQDTANLYHLVMELWRDYTKIPQLIYHVVRYENLISDFDLETKNLFQFLNIPWDPSVHKYNVHAKTHQQISTPSYHQVVEPIYNRSVYRWKNYATHIEPIVHKLRPHIERFDYSIGADRE